MKPELCTFMGVYVLRYLKEAAFQHKQFDIYAEDFCVNAKDSVDKRV